MAKLLASFFPAAAAPADAVEVADSFAASIGAPRSSGGRASPSTLSRDALARRALSFTANKFETVGDSSTGFLVDVEAKRAKPEDGEHASELALVMSQRGCRWGDGTAVTMVQASIGPVASKKKESVKGFRR